MPQGSKILIVEDEMIISMEIKQKLRGMGYEVVGQAITGESAILKAGETNPDLVLMDIRLKGEMDGITAAKRIIELYDLPIIFLTAHSDKATLERAIAVSPSGYLLKPFKERELMTNIEMSLHKHRIKKKVREEIHPETISELGKKIATLSLPAIILSKSGIIEEINQKAADIAGFIKQELIGKPASVFFTSQKMNEIPDPSVSSDTEMILPDQVAVRKKDGSIIPVTLTSGFIFQGSEKTPYPLMLLETGDDTEDGSILVGPDIIRHLVALTTTLRLPAFVIDKGMMLAGYNPMFAELARKAGISQYMLNRPLYETPKFSFFGDLQDMQEMFRGGETERRIRKYTFGEVIKFIEFTRIPLKKDGVTTHIATIMDDVTNERHALFEAEKFKKEYADLYAALEHIRGISSEMRTPIQDLLLKISDRGSLDQGYIFEMTEKISDLIAKLDTAWIHYAELKDQMSKDEKS
jgi:PAS domain S-box-containing protein